MYQYIHLGSIEHLTHSTSFILDIHDNKQTKTDLFHWKSILFIYLTVRKKKSETNKSHICRFGIKAYRHIRHTTCNSTIDTVARLCLQRAALCGKQKFQQKL